MGRCARHRHDASTGCHDAEPTPSGQTGVHRRRISKAPREAGRGTAIRGLPPRPTPSWISASNYGASMCHRVGKSAPDASPRAPPFGPSLHRPSGAHPALPPPNHPHLTEKQLTSGRNMRAPCQYGCHRAPLVSNHELICGKPAQQWLKMRVHHNGNTSVIKLRACLCLPPPAVAQPRVL